MRNMAIRRGQARAAGMAAATRGRSRRFDDRADLLEQERRADADAEIEDGVEEWRRKHAGTR